MRVVWTDNARDDLLGIGDYIARDDRTRAEAFVERLVEAGDRLAAAPLAFPLVARFERHGVRRTLVGRYLILYRIGGNTLDIIHVVHGARDYVRLLENEFAFGE